MKKKDFPDKSYKVICRKCGKVISDTSPMTVSFIQFLESMNIDVVDATPEENRICLECKKKGDI